MVQLSPGVQVIEKDYTQIAPSLSTTTGAFAGIFKWGPVMEPVAISSETDLVSVFGKPNDSNYQWFFTAKNFLEYSNQLYVNRVNTGSGRNAVAIQSGGISSITLTNAGTGYTSVPSVTLSSPSVSDGTQATAEATLTGGPIASVTVVSGGSGYSVGDIITLSDPEVAVDVLNGSGVVIESNLVPAKGTVTAVSGIGAIQTISFSASGMTFGNGYIDASTISFDVFNSTESASSAGTGANLTFTVQPSGIKSVEIINAGSGYVAGQTVNVIFGDTNGAGVDATATAAITASGCRINNKTHYESNFENGQGAYGEFAAKYMGDTGNSILVSMCDSTNWSSAVIGSFSARKNVESKENVRETTLVRRVKGQEETFSNEALDQGGVIRTSGGKYIGIIDQVDSANYRKLTLRVNSNYNVELDQHVKTASYGTLIAASTVARSSAGVVTITTATNHGLVAGQRVNVLVSSSTNANVVSVSGKHFEILSATNTTLTYQTDNKIVIPATASSGGVRSYSMATVDTFVKVYDNAEDDYVLSTKHFIVKMHNVAAGNDFAVNDTLTDENGVVIGVIAAVEQVQTIKMKGTNSSEVYDEGVRVEWQYKSLFNNNAPSTSSYAQKNGASNDEVHVVVIDADGKITGEVGGVLETFSDLSKASDAKGVDGKSIYYKEVVNASSNWVWVLDHPTAVDAIVGRTSWGSTASGTFRSLTAPVTRRLSGGVDTINATAGNIISAYEMFDDASKYDISLLPIGHVAASTASTIIQEVAERRKDCMVFVSAPLTIGSGQDNVDTIINYRNSLPDSSYAVLDSGWKYQYDKYSDKFRWVPLSGDIAGLCAYTEQVADAWYSPGGFNRGQVKNVVKLAFNPSQSQRDQLYTNGVNPVVTFPGEGTVLYGDKTLQRKASAFDRINVRRLFIVLEKTVSIASKYQLFEFNDDFTRNQFKGIVEPFLRDVQGRRGITDFLVKCDTSNNTPAVIDANQFVADIYIKPARSINFITLNFIATKTGVSFEEVGA